MKTYCIFCTMFLLVSCNSIDVVPLFNKDYSIIDDENSAIEYEERRDEVYGENFLQNYDIFLPKNQPQKVPVIVILHGGAWKEGHKGLTNPIVDYLKQKNVKCAIVNANYRLTFQKGVTYREQLKDIESLLKKLQSEAKVLNIVPKFFLMGFSAGGHLAMLYAFSSDKDNLVEVVGGIVSPSDLTSEKLRKGSLNNDVMKLIGKPFDENPEEYRNASPYFHVKRSSPPTIIFYGGNDNIIPEEQGTTIFAKLKEKNVKQEYYLYSEQSHDWGRLPETLDKMIIFADKYL